MIFDLSANSNGRKLPELNPDYPKDQSVTFIQGNNASAVFTAAISEDGRPAQYTYQWYADDAVVDGATEPSYTMSGFSASGTHKIYCVVTNTAGSVTSRTATLTVNMYTLPTLDSGYPVNASVEMTKSVTSKVVVSTAGNPNSYTYQWYKNGTAVSGATGSSYSFTPTAVGTTTVYCKVTNAAGTVTSRTATITATALYLYNSGNLYTANSGGWTARGKCTRTTNSDNLYIETTVTTGVTQAGYLTTSSLIDLTNFKTLTVKLKASGQASNIAVFPSGFNWSSYAHADNRKQVSNANSIFTLDVSSLTGKYYVGVYSRTWADSSSTYFYSNTTLYSAYLS